MKQQADSPSRSRTVRLRIQKADGTERIASVVVRDVSIPRYTMSVAMHEETRVIRSVAYVHKPNAKKRGAK